ncbi:expansin EXLX1 family cellulose-binding protein [Dactylosporangium sp. NPDC051541]|uniref:expansin EXLX1 family cellulose-binding protein n=1 Tax=Dactylosporangium sp. NPDC051541 TaxID=3363977 RepID=UPI00379131A3
MTESAWWRSRRMLIGAGAGVVVAGAATVALVAQASGAACAATVQSSAGQATYYAADGGGNCSFDKVSDPLVVALGNAEYQSGAACGGYLDVKGPKGSVRVKITDRCPECAAGHIDLSQPAFAKIGTISDGIIKVTYTQPTSPAVPGPVTVRVKEGASQYWLALRFDNTGNPLSTAEVQSGSTWKPLTRTDYNYWIAESGAGKGPFTVRITDTAGRKTTLTGVALTVGTVQRPGASTTSGPTTATKTTTATRTTAPPSSAAPSPTAVDVQPELATDSSPSSGPAAAPAASPSANSC